MDHLISIVIPVFNIQEYLSPCLDSVLNQTHKDIEVIVVDDGSTDQTPAIAETYARRDQRLRVIHKENGGVTSARLLGVSGATGEWVGFVDGDDYAEPEMFEHLLKNALTHGADISHCGYQMVFPDRTDYYYNTGRFMVQESREALRDLLRGSFEPGLCNKLFHRHLFHEMLSKDLMDTSIRINEDLLMNYYLFRPAAKTVFEDFCPYHYLIRRGSAATSKVQAYKIQDIGKVRRILMQETAGDDELYAASLESYTRHLIRTATMKKRSYPEEMAACIDFSQKELNERIFEVRQNRHISQRLKIQASIAAAEPGLYRFIHSVYGEISGAAHKYDIK